MTPSPPPASCSLPEPVLPPGLDITYQTLRQAHLEQVVAIEGQCFANPWSRGMFAHELSLPWAMDRVALEAGTERVVGYIILWLVAGEAQVQNIAVDPEYKRRGVGRWLLLTALAEAKGLGAVWSGLEVRAGNAAALALYQSLGYARLGVRPRYYQPENEDAILMGRDL
ncbi:MAG: ribosomal protein S18-alanine N-acetyltransferase [Desulfarculaceae bacterium]|nr:ribosomal protein S18-alanine N-acetyltransferase [Desulfarculaceae bacterium]